MAETGCLRGRGKNNKLYAAGHQHRESHDTFMVMRENFIKFSPLEGNTGAVFSTSTFGHAVSQTAR